MGCANPLGSSSMSYNFHPGVQGCSRVSYAQQVLSEVPIGYWRLDDSSTTAIDISGQNNNGIYENGVTLGVTGIISGDSDAAASFNGTTQFVRIPFSNVLANGSIKTVVTWVKTSSTNAVIFSVGDTVTDTYQIWITPGGLASMWSNNAEIDGSAINDGQWHMVVAVWDGVHGSIYVDSVLKNSGNLIIPGASALENQIGSQCTGAGSTGCNSFVGGIIDDTSVFNSAFSLIEIQTLFESTAIVPCGP